MTRNERLIAILVFVAAGASAAVDPPSPSERWRKSEISNMIIYSSASDRAVQGVIADFQRLRQTVTEVSKLETRSPIPTYVYLFRDEREFAPYRVAAIGEHHENVDGIFISESDANRVLLAADAGIDERIYHELTHYFVRNTVIGIPLWLDEGLAEFYASFAPLGGSRSVRVGLPQKLHLQFLQEQGLMPLRDLFVFEPLKYKGEDPRVQQFYAESWLFTHYLLIGNPERGAALGTFLSLSDEGEPLESAFKKAFGATVESVQAELGAYLRRGHYNAVLYTLSERGKPAIAPVREMRRDEVLAVLGELLIHTGTNHGGDSLLNESVKLNPSNATALANLALFCSLTNRPEEAEKRFKESIAAAGSDYRPYLWHSEMLAERLQQRAREGEQIAHEDILAVRQLAESAVKLAPENPSAYAVLGTTYGFPGEDPMVGIQASEKSFRLSPARLDVAADLVLLYECAGEEKLAHSMVDRVIQPSRNPRFLTEAQQNLVLGDYIRGIKLIQSGKKREGRSCLQRALDATTNEKLKQQIAVALIAAQSDVK